MDDVTALRNKLIAFYLQCNKKEKIAGVDAVAQWYVNKQDMLNSSLLKEYGADLTAIFRHPTIAQEDQSSYVGRSETTDSAQQVVSHEEFARRAFEQQQRATAKLTARLVGFYSTYNRAKLRNVGDVVQYYLGKESVLNESLHNQYGKNLDDLREATLAEKLTVFYGKYNPSKLQIGIDSIVAWYADKLDQLNSALRSEYEDDLDSVWVPQYVPKDFKNMSATKITLLHKWYEHKDLHGRLFYYNTETGECMLEKPDDFDGVSGEEIPQPLKVIMMRAVHKGVYLTKAMQLKKAAAMEAYKQAQEAADPNWVEVYDHTKKSLYYHNKETGEQTSAKPTNYVLAADDVTMSAVIKLQCVYRSKQAQKKVQIMKDVLQKKQKDEMDKKVQEAMKSHNKKMKSLGDAEKAGVGRWVECYDPAHEAYYYYETNTKEMTWEKPEHYVMAADDELMAAAIKIQCCWRARKARLRKKKMKSSAVNVAVGSSEVESKLAQAKKKQRLAQEKRDQAVADGHGHWVECYDPAHEAYYYYETYTHEMTWEKPEHYVMAADDELMAAAIKIQCCWRARVARKKLVMRAKLLVRGCSDEPYKSSDEKKLQEAKEKQRLAQEKRDQAVADGHGHWVECYDPAHEAYYYYETNTKEMTWEKPEHYVMAADDELMAAAIKIQCCWRARKARWLKTKHVLEGNRKLVRKEEQEALDAAKTAHASALRARDQAVADGHGHWVECYDPAHEAYYYYETYTHEMTWEKPEHYVMAADDELMAAAIKIQCCWRARQARLKFKKTFDGKKRKKLQGEEANKLNTLKKKQQENLQKMLADGGEHWIEVFDPESGQYYYCGQYTQKVTWKKPEHYVMAADDELMAAVIRIQNAWRCKKARAKLRAMRECGPKLLSAVMTGGEGATQAIRDLLAAGAYIDTHTAAGDTALRLAAATGNVAVVETLLAYKQNGDMVNTAGLDGFTPLLSASKNGHGSVARLLIAHLADPNLSDHQGMTPLMWASKEGRVALANFLIRSGAHVDTKSKPGLTALHLACKWQLKNPIMVALLLTEGADHSLFNNRFDSPLMTACLVGNLPAVQALMQADADVNLGSKGGVMPLHYAARHNHLEVCRKLKLADAAIHARTVRGITPVEEAKKRNHYEVLELLLCSGYPTIPKRLKGSSTAQPNGLTALSVTWLAPNGHGSVLSQYEVQHRMDCSDIQDYLIEYHVGKSGNEEEEELPWIGHFCGQTSTAINALLPGQQYQVRVRARNVLGWGKWSDIMQQRTELLPPDPPEVYKVETDGHGAYADVYFNLPKFNGGAAVTFHQVSCFFGDDDSDDQEQPALDLDYDPDDYVELQVTVCRARSLMKADTLGLSDPFCTVYWIADVDGDSSGEQTENEEVLGAEKIGDTCVITNTLDPVWEDEVFRIAMPPKVSGSKLRVEIHDKDLRGKSQFIGQVEVDGADIEEFHNEKMMKLRYKHTRHIEIDVVGCTNVIKADTFGKSDPYVIVFFSPLGEQDGAHEIGRTTVIKNTLDPKFNEHFKLLLPESCADSILRFEIFDNDKAGKDQFLGMAQFQGNEILSLHEQGDAKDGRLSIELKRKPYSKSKTKVRGSVQLNFELRKGEWSDRTDEGGRWLDLAPKKVDILTKNTTREKQGAKRTELDKRRQENQASKIKGQLGLKLSTRRIKFDKEFQAEEHGQATGTGSPIRVLGLNNNQTYVFRVRSKNLVGFSDMSVPSQPVRVPAIIPTRPHITSITPGNSCADVYFESPTHDGGERIKGFALIACHHGEKQFYVSGTASPIRVLGLTNGQAYTFLIYAINAVGNGPLTTDSDLCIPLEEQGEEAGKIKPNQD